MKTSNAYTYVYVRYYVRFRWYVDFEHLFSNKIYIHITNIHFIYLIDIHV